MQVEWSDSGFYSLNVLSLLPFRDTAGYERMYQPFWSLFEYRVKPDGVKYMGILMRTYYQVWNDDFIKIKIPLLLDYTSRGGAVTEFCMLARAFGYESEADATYMRILWIPFRIGKGTGIQAAEGVGEADDNVKDIYADLYFNTGHGNFRSGSMDRNIYASARF